MDTKYLARSAMIMAAYVALTLLLHPISYGPIQVRLAAGFNAIAAFSPGLIVPLGLATAIANYYGGLGIIDIMFGPLATAAAAGGCYLLRRMGLPKWVWLIAIPAGSAPVVAAYLSALFQLPFWVTTGYIFVGQTIAAYTVGWVMAEVWQRRFSY